MMTNMASYHLSVNKYKVTPTREGKSTKYKAYSGIQAPAAPQIRISSTSHIEITPLFSSCLASAFKKAFLGCRPKPKQWAAEEKQDEPPKNERGKRICEPHKNRYPNQVGSQ